MLDKFFCSLYQAKQISNNTIIQQFTKSNMNMTMIFINSINLQRGDYCAALSNLFYFQRK